MKRMKKTCQKNVRGSKSKLSIQGEENIQKISRQAYKEIQPTGGRQHFRFETVELKNTFFTQNLYTNCIMQTNFI